MTSWFKFIALCVFAVALCRAERLETLVAVPGSPDGLYGPAAPRFSQADIVHTNHPPFDIGSLWDFLDGKRHTLARTPSINPAYVAFGLKKPVSFNALRIKLIPVKHTYTLAAADSVKDLQSKSGSYRILSKGTTPDGTILVLRTNRITASAFRLDAERLEGDDYVHFFAWQFLKPVQIRSLIADYKIRQEHIVEPAIYEPLTMNGTRPVNSLLNMRVRAVTADGVTNDVTNLADIKYDYSHAKPFNGGPRIELIQPEEIRVSVRLGTMKKHGKITVVPRETVNKHDDIDVMFVERLPRIAYDAPNGGWPTNGQPVTWRAHVKNWGTRPAKVSYRWLKNGKKTGQGRKTIKGGETALIDFPTRWKQKRHTLRFETDVNPGELVTHNNSTEFVTDALTAGFYVEKSIADYYHLTQYKLGLDDANSFADWGRRQVRHWNRMLAGAKYPETPEGCSDRIRLDRVIVVPDTALPMKGGLPTNNPNNEDKTVDLIWGFPFKCDQTNQEWHSILKAKESIDKDNWHPFFMSLALFHELGHARYLIDGYGFDVHTGPKDDPHIRIKDDSGKSILGTYLHPDGIVHRNKYPGLMGGDYHQLSRYDAVMLNRVAGKRARSGNYNGPAVIGEFLQDIPEKFKVRFTGPEGEVLAGAPVTVYWATRQEGNWYGKTYDNTPDRTYTTDAQGCITADKTLFSDSGRITHTYGWANSVPVIRIDYKGQSYYLFLEVSELNIMATVSKGTEPVIDMRVPLRTGDPQPIDRAHGRDILPDWRTVAPFKPLVDNR
jgi:hypothetical protein